MAPDQVPEVVRGAHLAAGAAPGHQGAGLLVVDLATPAERAVPATLADELATFPGVTVGVATGGTAPGTEGIAAALDVLLTDAPDLGRRRGWVHASDEAELAAISATAGAAPIAARVLVQVLRCARRLGTDDGLLVESAAYSTLQAGPEFARWLQARQRPPQPPDEGPRVTAEQHGETLHFVLDRPHARNAFDKAMREQLTDLLAAAALDTAMTGIVLRGRGPAFCAGGDLDEFGTLRDPATAHLVRTDRSPARLLARISGRVEARVHGACIGAGIELPAFAHRLVAAEGTQFGLPEVGMGLIPGAGGTVSLPRRIGPQRTAYLALCGHRIDAATALGWGLVDEIADVALDGVG